MEEEPGSLRASRVQRYEQAGELLASGLGFGWDSKH